jgi:hypothetical protein
MLPRIKNIISVKPYQITCLWNTGEVRTIDLSDWIDDAKKKTGTVLNQLINADVFNSVKIDKESETICWENLLTAKDSQGNITKANLDFCPDVLYKKSVPG